MAPPHKLHQALPAAASAGTDRYNRLVQAGRRRRQAMAGDRAVSGQEVREILAELDRQTGRGAGQWTVGDAIIKGRESWIFKAESAHAPFPLALKVYCTAVEPKEIARQDQLLRRYHEAMASRPELTVPEPWAVLPAHRALIMQWINEPGLDTLLQRAGRRQEERATLFAAAGGWLRHFHDQSCPAVKPLQPETLRRVIDLQLGGEHGAGSRVGDRAFRNAYRMMVKCSAEFAGVPLPHATVHGDFQAKNLLHGRGTFGIDISGRPNAPVTNDIFHFLVRAEVERPILTRPAFGIDGPDAQSFLAAYGASEHLGDERLMTFLYLVATIKRWAHRIRLLRQRRYRIFRVVQVLRLRRMASGAILRLEPRLNNKRA